MEQNTTLQTENKKKLFILITYILLSIVLTAILVTFATLFAMMLEGTFTTNWSQEKHFFGSILGISIFLLIFLFLNFAFFLTNNKDWLKYSILKMKKKH